jgi:magnesium-transporting ATPase (P-type)
MNDQSSTSPAPSSFSGRPAASWWHATDVDAAVKALRSNPQDGLSETEARRRQDHFGANRLPTTARPTAFKRLVLQFHNLLIYVLLAAAVISLLLDHPTDAAVILAVVVINAAVGFIQEGRAERALEAIRDMINPHASIVRDGRRRTVAADQVVPGDIVLIEAGDRVPADMRLIRARNLKVEEAVLTGESVPVEKGTDPVAEAAVLGDRASMAFSGTFVASGHGAGVVVAIGTNTELGRISTLLGTVETLKTPLIRQMDGFARHLTLVILGISVLTFIFAYLVRGYAVADAFMVVVGLAVAAIPEGLPAIMTVTLAIGVQRMASRNAIIRRLPAVETLGSVSVICTDKTGTLTRNEMTARSLMVADFQCETSGVGYAPAGKLQAKEEGLDPLDHPALGDLVRTGLLCNDADIHEEHDGRWVVDGDPMEGALVTLAVKAGVEPAAVRKTFARTDEIPFDAAHRFMATLHHDHQGKGLVLAKGAPERILELCSSERCRHSDQPLDRAAWHSRAEELAAKGQRVLAFASQPAKPGQQRLSLADLDGDATLIGLIGFIDPPREEAIDAVNDCRGAGIRVVMITGDHVVTAREIARQLGLADDPKALTGQDLDGLDADTLRQAALETTVFARTTPEHKLRLVGALQADGVTVAMTGDGVNDAPALKRADVGVAMGQKGTEAAKEAAEMVLADDNFASIVAAVREGRTVYDNLMKVIAWTLPTNGGEALTILAALALGFALPITPVQILWINMVTAVALGLTFAFEPSEPGAMQRPPRPAKEPILTGDLLWRVAFVSFLFVSAVFGMLFWSEQQGLPIETARTIVVNTIVVMEIFYLFSVRYTHGTSLTWRGFIGTPAVLIGVVTALLAQIAFTFVPVMHLIFASQPIGVSDAIVILGAGVALLLVVELEKKIRHRLKPGGKGN